MTSWTAFVGQVARLRRLIGRVLSRARARGRHVEPLPARAGAPAAGPPAHWVERVRQGAPGLLEPSFRSGGEPVPAVEDGIGLPQPEAVAEPETGHDIETEHETEHETEVERRPAPRAESESEHVPTSEQVSAERPPTPRQTRASSLRKPRPLRQTTRRPTPGVLRKAPVLRSVLRRKRSSTAVPPASVDPSAAAPASDVPRELASPANPQPVQQPLDPPATALRVARGPAGETDATRVTATPAAHDEPEHRPHRATVVEFEAPVDERRIARVARPAGRFRRPVAVEAARAAAAEPARTDGTVNGVRSEDALQRVAGPPPPRSTPNVERARNPTARPRAWAESSVRASRAPAFRGHDDPLSAVDGDPWPELPAALDQADDEVETALRAWERQRRLDREQTRL